MRKLNKIILRISLKVIAWLTICVMLSPLLLYIPFVQNIIKEIAIEKLSEATGWEVKLDNIRINFPCYIDIENLIVKEHSVDTMIAAKNIAIDVKLLPLLKKQLAINSISLANAKYNLLTEDHSVSLGVNVKKCRFEPGEIDLADHKIHVSTASLNGGTMSLYIYPELDVDTATTSDSAPWIITAGMIKLHNLEYEMGMLPYIDKLEVSIADASLSNGMVDTNLQLVDVKSLAIDRAACKYFIPHNPAETDTIDSADDASTDSTPWTIKGNNIRLSHADVVYALSGHSPNKGLDTDYIALSDLNIAVDSFLNHGSELVVPLKNLSVGERCGLKITDMHGNFAMDSTGIFINGLMMTTDKSSLSGNASVDRNIYDADKIKNALFTTNLNADIALSDVLLLYPAAGYFLNAIKSSSVKTVLTANGSINKISIDHLDFSLDNIAKIAAKGYINNPTDTKKLGCNISLKGKTGNIDFIKPIIFDDIQAQKAVGFPPLNLSGRILANNGTFTGNAALTMASGDVVLDAMWNGKSTDYDISFTANTLPLAAIFPTSRLELLSGDGMVKGHGFDIFNKSTKIEADISIDSLLYNSKKYYGINLSGSLSNGKFNAQFASKNKNWDFIASATGILETDHYIFNANADVNDLNLHALRLMDITSQGSCNIQAFGDIDLHRGIYEFSTDIENLRWTLDDNFYYTDMIELDLDSDSTNFNLYAENNDFSFSLASECNFHSIMTRLSHIANVTSLQWKNKYIDTDSLHGALPPMSCEVKLGSRNIVQQFLNHSNISYKSCELSFANDSTMRLSGIAKGLGISGTSIDTLKLSATELNKRFNYALHIANRKETIPQLAYADLSGHLSGSTMQAVLTQHDFDNKQGINIGISAELSDTAVMMNLFPDELTIGYKQWTVNENNRIAFNYKDKHFDSNLKLTHADSYLSLTTEHNPDNSAQEDILLKIANVQIADWLSLSPFAPPVKGIIGADFKIKYNSSNIWGDGMIALDNLTYDKRKVGKLELNTFIDLNPATGGTNATANLEVNDRQCVVAFGSINDSIQHTPLKLVLEIDKFPLSTINPFLPKDLAEISGDLNGLMDVSGSFTKPILNGYINCDSTSISMPVFGSSIALPPDKIPIDSNLIKFNNFAIKALNENPLLVDGNISIHDTTNPLLNLNLSGRNVQFVNSKQTRKSEIFGRGYLNIDASAKGHLSDFDVNASVTLLAGSNLTYIMQSDVNAIAARQEQKMVKFVEFNDSSYIVTDSVASQNSGSLNLDANLNIQSGTTLNVYISKNGQDRAQIFGNGNLHLSMNRLGDKAMTGRFNIESGFVKYSPPLISQKLFNFNSGSYVLWTGSITNPTLNLSAVETHKTNVTESGADSRIINFLITLSVKNTLSDMKVDFNLDTNDDITIQNELQSMSAAQRSSQAVNLLLYNTYTGKDTKATGNLSGNPLFSFITSRLNNWAASAMKGITVTFGFDNYEETHSGVSSKAMRYSYQVSKSLFDDRFKIVIGGNYTQGNTSTEDIAQNLFNDVSLEYMLNKNGNMFVRLFNQKGFVNVLEGEVTQTGVAFVYKRKLTNLKYLFRFLNGPSKSARKRTDSVVPSSAIMPKEDSDSVNPSKR